MSPLNAEHSGRASFSLICAFFLCAVIGGIASGQLARLGLEDQAIIRNSGVLIQDICVVLACLAVAREMGLGFACFRFRLVGTRSLICAIAFALVGLTFSYGMKALVTLVVARVDPHFSYTYFGYHAYRYQLVVGPVGLTFVALAQFVVAPIAEELFFRSLLLRLFARKYGLQWALVLSSLLFSLFHFNKNFYIGIFVFSILAGLLYVRSGSLCACSLFHSLTNVSGFTLQYVVNFRVSKSESGFADPSQWIPELALLAVSVPAVLVIMVWFWPRKNASAWVLE